MPEKAGYSRRARTIIGALSVATMRVRTRHADERVPSAHQAACAVDTGRKDEGQPRARRAVRGALQAPRSGFVPLNLTRNEPPRRQCLTPARFF